MSKSKFDGGNTDTTEDVKSETGGTVNPIPGPHPPPKRILFVIDTIIVLSLLILVSSIILKTQYQTQINSLRQ